MTWAYRDAVLDLEPHGPLPTQIYWRRRALALGIAALVVGVIAAVVIMIVSNSAGAETKNADKPTPAATRTPLPGENPEVKTPVVPPAEHRPAPTPPPTAAVTPPPGHHEGDDGPDAPQAAIGRASGRGRGV